MILWSLGRNHNGRKGDVRNPKTPHPPQLENIVRSKMTSWVGYWRWMFPQRHKEFSGVDLCYGLHVIHLKEFWKVNRWQRTTIKLSIWKPHCSSVLDAIIITKRDRYILYLLVSFYWFGKCVLFYSPKRKSIKVIVPIHLGGYTENPLSEVNCLL